MRSARMLLVTGAATAALAISVPIAYADASGDRDHKDSAHSKEHDKDSRHDSPRGGMHTGGGALTTVSEDDGGAGRDARHDPQTYEERDGGRHADSWSGDHDKDRWKPEHDKDRSKPEHDKPRGGMHTGGGALATPGVTSGGLAVLAVAGTGLYALRRKKASDSVA
ncbi:hypothetical protein [Streptomyces sp. 2A115]|uniref:hypothetical protein n=1 Tax=Streptomyces sp. 2A115 TaxID=3457439 RepID=UPI003FD026B6